MANCLNCGAEGAPQAAVCSECGTKLPPATRLGAQTMLGGVSPFTQNQEDQPPRASAAHATTDSESKAAPLGNSPALASTMLGMPSPFVKELTTSSDGTLAAQPAPDKRALSGTMVGMPTPALSPQPDVKRALSGTMVGMPTPALSPQPDAKRALSGTMVGMPSPVTQLAANVRGVDVLSETQAQGSQRGFELEEGAPPDKVALPSAPVDRRFQGTLMGIAQPGIAPTYENPPAPPRPFESDPPPSSVVSSDRWSNDSSFPRRSRPMWQSVAFISLGLIAAAGFGALFAKMSEPDLSILVTRFAVDESGQDQLDLSCSSCADGTTLRVGGATTKFEKGVAKFLVEKPLSLGQNQFELSVQGPDGKKLSAAPLVVPVAFRMSSSWDGRHATPPFGQVTVQAPAGSTIKIDGKPAQVSGGKAEYKIPVDEKTLGESREIERVVFDVPIEVISDDKTRSTRASLRGGITPLQLTSIAPIHELSGKAVSITGVSMAGAKITFGDTQTEANEKGEFSLVISNPQQTTGFVTAQTNDLLLRRVALQLTSSAPTPDNEVTRFEEITAPTFARLTAHVIESRVIAGVTRSLLELQQDCLTPPCLLSTTFAEPRHLVPNRSVTVSGWAIPGDPVSMKVTKFH